MMDRDLNKVQSPIVLQITRHKETINHALLQRDNIINSATKHV